MSARKEYSYKIRHTVRVFSKYGLELTPTTPARARKLLKAKVAKKFKTWDGDFAIKLTTETRTEAFNKSYEKNSERTRCWACGKEEKCEDLSKRHWCSSCLEEYEKQRNEDLQTYLRVRARMMLDRALLILERQQFPVNIYDYKVSSEEVNKIIEENPSVFDSAYEMVVMMELKRVGIPAECQRKVGGHQVDFLLEGEKIVLEIDGWLHQYKKDKDIAFDEDVLNELGEGWEVIRIPTEFVELNIKQIVPAIRAIKKMMQREREKNNGRLPSNYILRDKKAWERIRNKIIEERAVKF